MTFLLGIGMGPVGVICADTRLNLQRADGTWERDDVGLRRFLLRDGSVSEVPPSKRKLCRVEWGWVAASASSHLLSQAIFERLDQEDSSQPSQICSLASEVVMRRGPGLRAELSGPNSDEQVSLIYIYEQGGRFRVGQCAVGVDFEGPDNADYVLSLPSDCDARFMQEMSREVGRRLFVPSDASGLWEFIRCVADVVYRVHTRAATVSDHIDLVVRVREATSGVTEMDLHGRSSEIRTASDSRIAALIASSDNELTHPSPVRDREGSGQPAWVSHLPEYVELTSYQIQRLEIIRASIGESDAQFALHLRGHPECVRMLQTWMFTKIKHENPGLTDEVALGHLIVSRFLSAQLTGDDLFGLEGVLMRSDQTETEIISAVQEVMRSRGLRDLDDVVDAILEEEVGLPTNPPVPGNEEAARQVTLILEESRRGAGGQG